jgi:DNA methylase
MGSETTPDEYVSGLVEVFREVKRVLRDDGTVWLNLGSSFASKTIESATLRIKRSLPSHVRFAVAQALSKMWSGYESPEQAMQSLLHFENYASGKLREPTMRKVRTTISGTHHASEARSQILLASLREIGQSDAEARDPADGVFGLPSTSETIASRRANEQNSEDILFRGMLVYPQSAGTEPPLVRGTEWTDVPRRPGVAKGSNGARSGFLPPVPLDGEDGSPSYPSVAQQSGGPLRCEQRHQSMQTLPSKAGERRDVSGGGTDVHCFTPIENLDYLTFHRLAIPPEFHQYCEPISVIKAKDDIMLPFAVAAALRADGWWLRQDNIWAKRNCLSGGAWLYAKTAQSIGPMMLKDLIRLSPQTVQLWNGSQWTRVMAWHRGQCRETAIEIVLRSGERVGCTSDHIWPTANRGEIAASELRVGDSLLHCKIPKSSQEAPWMNADAFWFAGLYLAEGCINENNGSIHIAGHVAETDRIARLRRTVAHYGGTMSVYDVGGLSQTVLIYSPALAAVIHTLIAGNSAHCKRLTATAWACATESLHLLAEGYLHGDGANDGNRIRLGFCRNYSLERDIRCLASRLGATLTLRPSMARNQNGAFPSFKGEWRWSRSGHLNEKNRGEIIEIRKSRARQFWDVTVQDAPYLFALASGLLTHNCMPESVRDRTTRSHEYVFHLTKSGAPTFWTHRDRNGTRNRPDPDYRWVKRDTKEEVAICPQGWPEVDRKVWRRINLWDGHDTFYDATAIEEDGVYPAGTQAGKGSRKRSDSERVNSRPPEYATYTGKRNKRSVWWETTVPFADAHFATMAPAIATTCILAGSSERGCCPACGAPWSRILERTAMVIARSERTHELGRTRTSGTMLEPPTSKMIGWRPTCDCPATDPVPCTILDPFAGAFTTCLVANRLQRDAIGIELNPEYIEMAKRRIHADAGLFAGMSI